MGLLTLLHRIRSVRSLHVFLGSALIWAAVVGCFAWVGWEGGRTAEDAYVPLRPLSVREAAALLTHKADTEHPGAVIAQMTENHVLLVTPYYLLPFKEDPVESTGIVSHGGSTYHIYSSSWAGYANSHLVTRKPLERELGRPLSMADVKASLAAKRSISFSSQHVWIYALTETLFLALVTMLAHFFLSKVSEAWMLVPALTFIQAIIFAFVLVFSPAFLDADWFYQRIFIERLWVPNAVLLGLSSMLSLPLVLVIALSRIQRTTHRLWGIAAWRFWGAMGIFLGLVLITLAVLDFAAFRREQAGAKEMFDRLAIAMAVDDIQALREAASPLPEYCNLYKQALVSAEVMKKIDRALDTRTPDANVALSVFLPLKDERYLYLSNRGSFRYADVRMLQSSPMVKQIHHGEIVWMLENKTAYHARFWSYLWGQFLEGRPLFEGNGVLAVCLVDPGGGSTATNLAFVTGILPSAGARIFSVVFYVPHQIGDWFWRA